MPNLFLLYLVAYNYLVLKYFVDGKLTFCFHHHSHNWLEALNKVTSATKLRTEAVKPYLWGYCYEVNKLDKNFQRLLASLECYNCYLFDAM